MAGHSKWSNIKHRKAAQDKKRERIFTRLIREIQVAARTGGGDPDGNPRLRAAIASAQDANMPKDKIERAIKRGTGELEGAAYEEMTYEGYGPEGVAMLVDVATDNQNRVVASLRGILNKRGGKMAEPGAVSWLFEPKGRLRVDRDAVDYDRLVELAVEAGAEDVREEEDAWLVTTARPDLWMVADALEQSGLELRERQQAQVPQNVVEVDDVDKARKVIGVIEAIEDNDDVQTVWSNFDVTSDVAQQLQAE